MTQQFKVVATFKDSNHQFRQMNFMVDKSAIDSDLFDIIHRKFSDLAGDNHLYIRSFQMFLDSKMKHTMQVGSIYYIFA